MGGSCGPLVALAVGGREGEGGRARVVRVHQPSHFYTTAIPSLPQPPAARHPTPTSRVRLPVCLCLLLGLLRMPTKPQPQLNGSRHGGHGIACGCHPCQQASHTHTPPCHLGPTVLYVCPGPTLGVRVRVPRVPQGDMEEATSIAEALRQDIKLLATR